MKSSRAGFTIIEILVVLVVIGIILSITAASYSTWRTRTAETEVKNDLKHAVTALKNHRNFHDTYPAASNFSTVFTPSENVKITAVQSGVELCLEGTSLSVPSVEFMLKTSGISEPVPGSC